MHAIDSFFFATYITLRITCNIKVLLMCYSPEASLSAFVVTTCTSLVLVRYNAVLGWFFLYVGLMQLFDLIFWTHRGQNNINWRTTKVAMIVNHLQPLVLMALLWKFGSKPIASWVVIAVMVYAVVVMAYSVDCWNKISYTVVDVKSAPSLYWQWNDVRGACLVYGLYLFALVALCLDGFAWPLNVTSASVVFLSFILSMYYYKGQTSVGRFWCYFAAYVPLLIIGLH